MKLSFLVLSLLSAVSFAASKQYLVKLSESPDSFVADHGGSLSLVSEEGRLFLWSTEGRTAGVAQDSGVEFIEPNRTIRLIDNPSLIAQRDQLIPLIANTDHRGPAFPDNPELKAMTTETSGTDPMLGKSWGIDLIGANKAWSKLKQGDDLIVAVTDTGVDYNHADLINNMWRNPGEIAGDGIDNDKNGYVDDVVGWDFYSNDNKPYDLSLQLWDILLKGGNPGHGTHVAGVIGARLNNALGTAGVAPRVKIMALRFISENGQGDTAAAVKCVDYAVANGAKIINASWGSEGEEEGDAALREAIQRAEAKGVIFVAAAGNGRLNSGGTAAAGFNNDTDAKPMYPSSYPYENIVAVAAINSSLGLADFSNFGPKTVDLAAPGVNILSTVPGDKYQDVIIDLGGMKVTWDGTSMASPFVAGSLAVIWAQEPKLTAAEAKAKLLAKTVAVDSVAGKVLTGGRVDLHGLLQ